MKNFYHSVTHRPAPWLIGSLVLLLFLGLQIRNLEIRTDGSALYPEDSAVVKVTEYDQARYKDSERIIALISSDNQDIPVASSIGLRFIRTVHNAIAGIPGLTGAHVVSLATLPDARLFLGALHLDYSLDNISNDSTQFNEMLLRIQRNSAVNGVFLSGDGKLAAIYVTIPTDCDRQDLLERITNVLGKFDTSPFSLNLTGPVVAEATLGDIVIADLQTIIPLTALIITLLLAITLRSIGGVIVTLIESLVTLVAVFGLMALSGAPLTLVTTILPVVLLVFAITDEIHLIEAIQRHLRSLQTTISTSGSDQALCADTERNNIRTAVAQALQEVGPPIFITSITTAVAFLSFLSASIAPVRDFGLFTSIGIILAMIMSFTLIPALIVVLPTKLFVVKSKPQSKSAAWWRKLQFTEIAQASQNRRWRLLPTLIVALVIALSVPGIFMLRVEDSWIDNFNEESQLVRAEQLYNSHFWGSYRFDVVFEASKEFFHRPEGLALLERAHAVCRSAPFVGGCISPLTGLKAIATSLNVETPLVDLPSESIAELEALSQMTDPAGLESYLYADGSGARLQAFVNSPSFQSANSLRSYLSTHLSQIDLPPGVSFHFSGDLPVALAVVGDITMNQIRSFGWTTLGIAIFFLFIFPRGKAGALCFLPVGAAITLLLGVIGYAGIPLGVATSMFASIVLGVGVDFSLHYLYRYRKERLLWKTADQALKATNSKTGTALRWSSITLSLGMAALIFSDSPPNAKLGALLASAMLLSYGLTRMILPGALKRIFPLFLITASLSVPLNASAQEFADSASEPIQAAEILLDIERNFRRIPRAVKIDILSDYLNGAQTERTIWSLVDGDTLKSRILYVFTEPKRLAGMTMLIHDNWDESKSDSMWIHLPALKHFKPVYSRAQRVMVPGMALSYEDSRGFIPTQKYFFLFADSSSNARLKDTAIIIARPRTDSVKTELNYSYLRISVDRSRKLVARVEFYDLNERRFKIYNVDAAVLAGEIWLPERVTMEHSGKTIISTLIYKYWTVSGILKSELFRPSVQDEGFLIRLEKGLNGMGLEVYGVATDSTNR